MEGFLFFWIFWIYWVLTTFFMQKQKERLYLSAWLLLMIALSIHSIEVHRLEISLAGLFLLVTTYYLLGRESFRRMLYGVVSSFIIMLAYATFKLMEIYDPVFVFIDRNFMLSAIIAYLAILLQSELHLRILSILVGTIHGEMLFSFILRDITFTSEMATLAFFDVVALGSAILLGLGGFKKISLFFEGYFKQQEKEKQKLS